MEGVLARRIVVCLIASFFLLLSAAAAHAERAPTAAEREGLLQGLANSGVDRCEVGGLSVSTVDPDWAKLLFGLAPGESGETCPQVPSGIGFLKRTRSDGWRLTAVASDLTCRQKGLPPIAVQRDLGSICHFDYPGLCEWKGKLPRYVEIVEELVSEGVGCGGARSLVRAYHAKTARIRANPGRVGAYRCEESFEGAAMYVTCRKRPVREPYRLVRWFAYYPGSH